MELTAKEWLLLSEKEQAERAIELSSKECFLLRTSLSYIRFTEEEKKKMTEKQKKDFIDPPKREYTSEEMKLMQMSITEKIAYLFDGEKEK